MSLHTVPREITYSLTEKEKAAVAHIRHTINSIKFSIKDKVLVHATVGYDSWIPLGESNTDTYWRYAQLCGDTRCKFDNSMIEMVPS